MEHLFDPEMFSQTWESLQEQDNCVVATYYIKDVTVEADFIDHMAQVKRMALEGSTSSWERVSEDTPELRARLTSKVIGYYEIPSPKGTKQAVIQLAYPIGAWGVPITTPMLMMVIAGTHIIFPDEARLLDLYFPEKIAREFRGPRFGVEGVREMLGVYGRPLLLHIIKPKMGMTPEETAHQVYETATGGADLVKDDEMLVELDNCPLEARLEAVTEALARVEQETGRKVLYMLSITDEASRTVEKAQWAVQNGATGFFLAYSAGLSTLRALAEDARLPVPIMVHASHAWALLPKINYPVISKLCRLCGADMMLSPSVWSIHPVASPEETYRNAQVLQAPFYHIKRTFPQPAGGIYPGTTEVLVEEFGLDFVLPAGGGILGHPMGYRAGAAAMRQALDAVTGGIPLAQAAKDPKNKELLAALEKWGLRKRPKTQWGYLGKDFNPETAEKGI